jgi:CubicO group peptidase (beta-lactamase class C family)
VVGRADTILYSKGYGRFTWSPKADTPDPATTLWDLASISKVVATTSAAAVLVDQGRLNLDASVHSYLPEFTGGGKDEVTVRMLLNHTSGLPPDAPLYREAHSPDEALEYLYAVPLARAPGVSPVYSDLNAILAGVIIEKISGKSLDAFADSVVFAPFGMVATGYRPPAADRTRAMPTSRYHGVPVAGIVNDQNAQVFGGVAGHAGLFSTGLDLARFAQSWMKDSTAKSPWLAQGTLTEFLQRTPTSGTRALGWDTPNDPDSGKASLFGRCATSTTIGHTGWTGTELWLDPVQNMFVIFLTNRSYDPRAPKRSFLQLGKIRAEVADAARRALGLCAHLAVSTTAVPPTTIHTRRPQ